jgi:hypothetical protein
MCFVCINTSDNTNVTMRIYKPFGNLNIKNKMFNQRQFS